MLDWVGAPLALTADSDLPPMSQAGIHIQELHIADTITHSHSIGSIIALSTVRILKEDPSEMRLGQGRGS